VGAPIDLAAARAHDLLAQLAGDRREAPRAAREAISAGAGGGR
jgi:hypothetical protein